MRTLIPATAPEPRNFQTRRTCLFLGVDGTLADVQMRPDQVRIDDELIRLLGLIQAQLDGAVALVSGRPLEQLDYLFAPLRLPAAGLHGFERRCAEHRTHRPPLASDGLDAARAGIARLCAEHHGLLLEDKRAGFALHYRMAPALAALALHAITDSARELGPDFAVLQGDCVVELKPAATSKATAVEAFLEEDPFAGRIPIYIGDNGTDFDGFSAVQRNRGVDIVVGSRIPARWRLDNPAAVRSWLERFAAQGARIV